MQSGLPKRIGIDILSIEKRILSRLAGRDLHRERASKIFNIPEEEVTESMRMYAKKLYYLEVYGGSPKWMI